MQPMFLHLDFQTNTSKNEEEKKCNVPVQLVKVSFIK